MITISPDPFPFKSHLPKCIQTRYVPNKIRFWRVQYQFVKMHGYHVYVPRCARVTFSFQLRENGRNNSQHCWPNIAGSCCVRLHVAKSLNGFKLCATTRRGVPRHFLFVSLGGAYWGEKQYWRVSAHKEIPRRHMLGGSGDMPSRKILKIQVLWDVIWCNLGG